jgi:hypothetical protein
MKVTILMPSSGPSLTFHPESQNYMQLRPPSTVGINQQSDVRVTSIHLTATRYSMDTIIASYLNHGVVYDSSLPLFIPTLIPQLRHDQILEHRRRFYASFPVDQNLGVRS